MIDLDRIDEYCRKATGEPWVNMPEGALWGSVYSAPLDGFTEICVMPEGDDRTPDFDFIAQARTDLPAVVAELREARELLERLCDGLSEGHGWSEAYEETRKLLGM